MNALNTLSDKVKTLRDSRPQAGKEVAHGALDRGSQKRRLR